MSIAQSAPPGRGINSEGRGWRRVGLVFLVLLTLAYGLPLLWMLGTSLKEAGDLATDGWLPSHPTTAAYRSFFATDFLPALRNSVVISTTTTLLSLGLAVPAAYGLSRTRSRLIVPGLVLLLVVQLIPTSATFIPLFRLLAQLGLVNSQFGVSLAQATLFVPFAVLILRPAFNALPPALEEAASIDGAGRARFLLRIALPLLRNTVLVTAAIVLVSSWGELVYSLTFLLEQDKYPLSVYIAQSVGRFNNTWNLLMSVAVLASLPVLLVVLAAQRRLRDGVTLGAVK
ncbi:carbohydrate ABC transporter permease [Micromonospora sp. NPDC050980]|uniref:carbohydrate ABC transporter permease n=1 Tax=Micromonospora sp. NPDC050980 TaxID=3155161 RepID=UPI0033EAF348